MQRSPLEAALPPLLEKMLERGLRVVVRLGSAERVQALDALLWTWRNDSFLPHGTAADGRGPHHPIYVTDGTEVPNAATVLVLADGAWTEDLDRFDIACCLFDGVDSEALSMARARYRDARSAGHALTYWQQTANGGWQKKA